VEGTFGTSCIYKILKIFIFYILFDRIFLLTIEMAFKSPSSILFVNQTEFRRQKKNTSKQSFCRVCDGETRYIHYGSLVCSSCKTFFRRYASYTKVLNFYLNYSIDIYFFLYVLFRILFDVILMEIVKLQQKQEKFVHHVDF